MAEDGEEVGIVPAGHQPFGRDADLGGPLLAQEIERDLPQHRPILRRMPRRVPTVVLTPEDRAALERRVYARTGSQQDALRARIVLLAADGLDTTAIATT